jgi:hypothetical protein
MREDMFKVIVERPRLRLGRHDGSRYRRGMVKSLFRDPEDAPSFQRMGFPRKDKHLNENLAPLKRYLAKQVGRRWDAVYAEISARVDRKSAVQAHVLQHIDDFVAREVMFFDGVPYSLRWGRVAPLRQSLYVCPLDGVLKIHRARKDRPAPPEPPIPLDTWGELRRVRGEWVYVELARIPERPEQRQRCFDVLLGAHLDDRWFSHGNLFTARFGRGDRYAVATRPAGKRELRRARLAT